MARVVFRRAAQGDLVEARKWYAAHGIDLADAFVREVTEALDRVAENPIAYPVVHRDVRRAFLRQFPYSLFYRVVASEIVVVACFHHRRDPQRWLTRR